MSISKELKHEVLKYNNKTFIVRENSDKYNIREIIKYAIYCKDIIGINKEKVGITGISFIQPEQQMEIGYGQLEQVSFGMTLDPKMPLDSFILSVIEFMNNNNFSEDKINLVKKFIDDYNIFMQPIEYKSPVYLTIAYLCLQNTSEILIQDPRGNLEDFNLEELVEGELVEGEFSDEDYGEEFGEDEDW
jgi:hypothetical protein